MVTSSAVLRPSFKMHQVPCQMVGCGTCGINGSLAPSPLAIFSQGGWSKSPVSLPPPTVSDPSSQLHHKGPWGTPSTAWWSMMPAPRGWGLGPWVCEHSTHKAHSLSHAHPPRADGLPRRVVAGIMGELWIHFPWGLEAADMAE